MIPIFYTRGIIAESRLALLQEEIATLKIRIHTLEGELKDLKRIQKYDCD